MCEIGTLTHCCCDNKVLQFSQKSVAKNIEWVNLNIGGYCYITPAYMSESTQHPSA